MKVVLILRFLELTSCSMIFHSPASAIVMELWWERGQASNTVGQSPGKKNFRTCGQCFGSTSNCEREPNTSLLTASVSFLHYYSTWPQTNLKPLRFVSLGCPVTMGVTSLVLCFRVSQKSETKDLARSEVSLSGFTVDESPSKPAVWAEPGSLRFLESGPPFIPGFRLAAAQHLATWSLHHMTVHTMAVGAINFRKSTSEREVMICCNIQLSLLESIMDEQVTDAAHIQEKRMRRITQGQTYQLTRS